MRARVRVRVALPRFSGTHKKQTGPLSRRVRVRVACLNSGLHTPPRGPALLFTLFSTCAPSSPARARQLRAHTSAARPHAMKPAANTDGTTPTTAPPPLHPYAVSPSSPVMVAPSGSPSPDPCFGCLIGLWVVLLPPVAVALAGGDLASILINVLFTMLGFLPGERRRSLQKNKARGALCAGALLSHRPLRFLFSHTPPLTSPNPTHQGVVHAMCTIGKIEKVGERRGGAPCFLLAFAGLRGRLCASQFRASPFHPLSHPQHQASSPTCGPPKPRPPPRQACTKPATRPRRRAAAARQAWAGTLQAGTLSPPPRPTAGTRHPRPALSLAARS